MTDVLYPSAPPIGITVTSWAELRLSVYNASLSGWGGTHAQVMEGWGRGESVAGAHFPAHIHVLEQLPV